MNDCEIFLNNEWVTIPIRGIDGDGAYVPVAPVSRQSLRTRSLNLRPTMVR